MGIERNIEKGDEVWLGVDAIETLQAGGYDVPENNRGFVRSNPDKWGRVVVAIPNGSVFMNVEWLDIVVPENVSVTLRLDNENLAKIEDVFMNQHTYEDLRAALVELGVYK